MKIICWLLRCLAFPFWLVGELCFIVAAAILGEDDFFG